jgi:hypothetical protein
LWEEERKRKKEGEEKKKKGSVSFPELGLRCCLLSWGPLMYLEFAYTDPEADSVHCIKKCSKSFRDSNYLSHSIEALAL